MQGIPVQNIENICHRYSETGAEQLDLLRAEHIRTQHLLKRKLSSRLFLSWQWKCCWDHWQTPQGQGQQEHQSRRLVSAALRMHFSLGHTADDVDVVFFSSDCVFP